MIEIGQNLKEMIDNIFAEFKHNNPTCDEYIDFVKQIKELITLSPKAKIYEYKFDDKKYPSKSGYYWFYNNGDIFPVHYNSIVDGFLINGCYHDFSTLGSGMLKNSYFIQPVQPIPEPGQCILKD